MEETTSQITRAYSSPDWCRTVAAALVTHSALTETAANGLKEAFQGVQEVRLALANGDQKILECFSLMEGGRVNRGSLDCGCSLQPRGGSASYECMHRCNVLEVNTETPDRDSYADWKCLSTLYGATWLLAAPLSCHDRSLSLVGAVVVAGQGQGPTIDRQWLMDWSCEFAKTLAHASVQLMESSLDMLHVIFPPKVLEHLLYTAVQSDPSPALQEAIACATAHAAASACEARAPSAAAMQLPVRHEQSGAAPLPGPINPGSVSSTSYSPQVFDEQQNQLLEDAQTSPFAALVVSEDSGEIAPPSPSLTHPPEYPAPPDAEIPSHSSGECDSSAALGEAASGVWPMDRRSPSINSHHSHQSHCSVVRQASIASGAAAALLKQASLRSDTSFLFEDAESNVVMSPHESEVEGFEDLLQEDAVQHAQRRNGGFDFHASPPSSRRRVSPPPPPPPAPDQHDSVGSMDYSSSSFPSTLPSSTLTSPAITPQGSPDDATVLPMGEAAERQGEAGRKLPTDSPPTGSLSYENSRAGGSSVLRPLMLSTAGAAAAMASSKLAEHAQQQRGCTACSYGSCAAALGESATPFATDSGPSHLRQPQGGIGSYAYDANADSAGGGLQPQRAGPVGERNQILAPRRGWLEAIAEGSSSIDSSSAPESSKGSLPQPGSPSAGGSAVTGDKLEKVVEETLGGRSGSSDSSYSGRGRGQLGGKRPAPEGEETSPTTKGDKLAVSLGFLNEAVESPEGEENTTGFTHSPWKVLLEQQQAESREASTPGNIKSRRGGRGVGGTIMDGQLSIGDSSSTPRKMHSVHSKECAVQQPQQRWDLVFVDAELEGLYRQWVTPRLLSHDRVMGWSYCIVAAATLLGLLCRGRASICLLALHAIGSALFLAPSLPVASHYSCWVATRSHWLAAARIASMGLYAAYMALVVPGSNQLRGEGELAPVLCLLWQTGVSCMLMGALRQLLPFSVHVPVQLLCLWIGTATVGIMNGRGRGGCCQSLGLPTALGAQVWLGFVLPTVAVYWHERRERQLFLRVQNRVGDKAHPE